MAGALALGVVDQSFHSLIVVSAVLTMAAGPPVISGGTQLVNLLSRRFRVLSPYRIGDPHSEERPRQTFGHVVICGLGRVGSLVAQELRQHDVPFTVVDLDPRTLDEWRTNGYHTVLGSSDREEVLRAARVPQAGMLVVTTGDPVSVEMTAYPGPSAAARAGYRCTGACPLRGRGSAPNGGTGGGMAGDGGWLGNSAPFPLTLPDS